MTGGAGEAALAPASALDRLIVALDRPSVRANRALVDTLGEHVRWYKVGLATFTRRGRGFVGPLVSSGKRVFLDLKFHDIPATVAGATAAAAELEVQMITVHAAGGGAMLAAAAEVARTYGANRPLVMAVTVLTSEGGAVAEEVVRRALLARDAGCDGVICSPQEAALVRAAAGPGFRIVTPGIRWADSAADDQARVATPAAAIEAGADQIVVGRPIHGAEDPVAAARRILTELDGVTAG